MRIKIISVNQNFLDWMEEEVRENFGLQKIPEDTPANHCETVSLFDGDNQFNARIRILIPEDSRDIPEHFIMDVLDYFKGYMGCTSVKWRGSFL